MKMWESYISGIQVYPCQSRILCDRFENLKKKWAKKERECELKRECELMPIHLFSRVIQGNTYFDCCVGCF